MGGKFLLLIFLMEFSTNEEVGAYGALLAAVILVSNLCGLDMHIITGRSFYSDSDGKERFSKNLSNQFFVGGCTTVLITILILYFFADINFLEGLVLLLLFFVEFNSHEIYKNLVSLGEIWVSDRIILLKSGAWCYMSILYFSLGGEGGLESIVCIWLIFSLCSLLYGGLHLTKFYAGVTFNISMFEIFVNFKTLMIINDST
jgi:hypothetical protein